MLKYLTKGRGVFYDGFCRADEEQARSRKSAKRSKTRNKPQARQGFWPATLVAGCADPGGDAPTNSRTIPRLSEPSGGAEMRTHDASIAGWVELPWPIKCFPQCMQSPSPSSMRMCPHRCRSNERRPAATSSLPTGGH